MDKGICFRHCVVFGFAAVISSPLIGQTQLDETVSVLEQWVDTERKIAEAEATWDADKATMLNLIQVYSQEIETLDEQIELATSDVSAAEARRNELTEREAEIKLVEKQVSTDMTEAEIAIKALGKKLPLPLKEELTPLFNALPENSMETKLSIGQRIQPIAAILTQTQKFNQVVTKIEDYREFEAGRTVQTETVYFGLGTAFYVDQASENAGFAVLGDEGWTWEDDDTLAPAIRSFLDIYLGNQQAKYVDLPIRVQ